MDTSSNEKRQLTEHEWLLSIAARYKGKSLTGEDLKSIDLSIQNLNRTHGKKYVACVRSHTNSLVITENPQNYQA